MSEGEMIGVCQDGVLLRTPSWWCGVIACYYALHTNSWWAQEIREGEAPTLWVTPSSACRTPQAAWEVCVGNQDGYTMVKWEWHGEISGNGCWLLTNPWLVL